MLYSFTGAADGSQPYGGLLRGSRAGNLYGTKMIGGAGDSGVVYKLDPAGNETVLYNFTGLLSLAAKTSAAALYTR